MICQKKIASLFLLGYDKKLKQNIKPLLPLEESNLLNFGPTENGEKIKKEVELKNHERALEILMEELIDNKIVSSLDEIKAIGHRIAQGGPYFDKTMIKMDINKFNIN